MTDLSIISPEKFTVGFQNRDHYKLAFATYKDKKGKLAKEKSFNSWIDSTILLEEYENKPTEGFKLHSLTKRSHEWFGSGRHVWRVEDPRGFVLEISSENLQGIIGSTVLKEGLITAPCIWAWSGQYLSLIPTCSDLYKDVIANNERHTKKVSKKDVKIGNTIVLKDGAEGIYYGKWWVLEHKYGNLSVRQVEILKTEKTWLPASKFQISEVKEHSTFDRSQAKKELSVAKSPYNLEYFKLFSEKSINLSDYYREEDLSEEDLKVFNFEFETKSGGYSEIATEQLPTLKIDGAKYLRFSKKHICKYGSNIDPGYLYFYGNVAEIKEKSLTLKTLPYSNRSDTFYSKQLYKNSDIKNDYRDHWNSLKFNSEKELHAWIKSLNPKKCYLSVNGGITWL